MPCDPKPGLWAYLVCALSLITADPLQIAATALLLTAAVSAALLARRRLGHRPIAWTLGAVFVGNLVGDTLAPALLAAGPHVGLTRAAFHIDEARFLLWPAMIQVAVGMSFVGARDRYEAATILRVALVPFYGFLMAIAVACYPALRGEALAAFYACVQLHILLWCVVVAGAWARRSLRSLAVMNVLRQAEGESPTSILTPARVVASLMVAMGLLSFVAGPWLRGLFGPVYRYERVILCILYAAIGGIQLGSLRAARGASPKPPGRVTVEEVSAVSER